MATIRSKQMGKSPADHVSMGYYVMSMECGGSWLDGRRLPRGVWWPLRNGSQLCVGQVCVCLCLCLSVCLSVGVCVCARERGAKAAECGRINMCLLDTTIRLRVPGNMRQFVCDHSSCVPPQDFTQEGLHHFRLLETGLTWAQVRHE